MKTSAVLFILSIVMLLPSALIAGDMPADRRIKTLRYDPDDVFVIYTLYGYQTNIEMAPEEQVQTISMGDRSLWQIIPARNRMFIRPMDDNVATNMTVITNLRSYQFDLKSGKGALEDNKQTIYVARFTYPEEEPEKWTSTPSVSSVSPVAEAPSFQPPANYRYTFTGPDSLAPIQVYDDGQATYIRYTNMNMPLPDAYLIQPDGSRIKMPVILQNGYMVISAINDRFVLMHGGGDDQVVYLYNEQFAPVDAPHG